jgi:hypothetical protein
LKVDELRPRPASPLEFSYATIKYCTEESGCYALTNASHDILYVGQAISLRQRLLQHLDAHRHNVLTPFGRPSLVWVLSVPASSALSAHERGWLNQCELADGGLPPLNKVHAPV